MTRLLGRFRDEDSTEKFVYESGKGIIEATWIRNKKDVDVFCLPTHHYCTLGCRFCHLTEEGNNDEKMTRIRTPELIGCLDETIRHIDKRSGLLLSFMGVGEPFLNPELVVETYEGARKTLGYEHIAAAVATMMPDIKPAEYLAGAADRHRIPLKLHLSLHSPDDSIRKDIIPCTKTSVEEALEALCAFRDATKNVARDKMLRFHAIDDPAELHYTVIEGVNDSDAELEKMVGTGQRYKIPLKLIRFNPTKQLKRSSREEIWFSRLSADYGARVVEYSPPGPNIGSSCGQFTKHYYLGSRNEEEEQEFLEWKNRYEVL